jgi:hypothetical protein
MAKYSRVGEIFQNLREGKAMMKKYTVLMLYPASMSGQYGDTYMAHVEAVDVEHAQHEGQTEASFENTDPDDTDPSRPEDFFIVFVCEGHVEDIKIW